LTHPVFRWNGVYWGFLEGDALYDRYGRQAGWLEGQDVFDMAGRFIGELRDGRHVVRDRLREAPIHRAPRLPVPHLTPPDPVPNRDPRDPLDDSTDGLPWPLPSPEPPRI
jgi:hypothetical protein